MKSDHAIFVERFMELAEQDVPLVPTVPNPEIRLARAKLILEEALETVEALGVSVMAQVDGDDIAFVTGGEFSYHDAGEEEFNMLEVIDGVCDSRVVNTGTLFALGIHNAEDFQSEVDQNNLDKFAPGGYKNADGKWIKPTSHRPPNLAQYLRTEPIRR